MLIELKDYKHLFIGNDATLALQEALRACAGKPGSILKLGGGTLHFYKEFAFEKEYYISNNDYSKKSIIFPLIGMKDITIDGEGAELFFHGTVLPFVIDHSEDITIKNLSVDYPHPFFFHACITAADENNLELTYDTEEFSAEVRNDEIVFFSKSDGWEIAKDKLLACECEADTKAPSAYISPYFAYFKDADDGSFLSGMYRYVKPLQLAPGKIRLTGEIKHKHTVGNMWVCTFAGRENPGIFGNRSKNILIENVTLYHTASMGVICQLCENVTMEKLRTVIRPDSGRYLSVNADSTHFVNCTGAIRYESCTFTNMLDDAGNTHGNYTRFVQVLDAHSLLATFGHFQQKGINLYDKGDQVHIVDNLSMQALATLTVKDSLLLSGDYIRLEFEEELPVMQNGYVIENFTKMPELYINNCVCGHNRPRGFLPGTWRKTVITNNTFFNMMCGLHFTGDANDWFESGPVNDVLIKGNNFKNSAYTGGAAIIISPHIKGDAAPFHKNIKIEENTFELHEERFLSAQYAENLIMRNNKFIKNLAFPSHNKVGENGISLKNCKNISAELPEKI